MQVRWFIPLLVMLAGAADAGTYDFAYTASGDPRLIPLQVFDDGKRTWLQLPQMYPQPAIFAVTPAGEVILASKPEGQMLVVDRVEQQLAVVLGRSRATVRYIGATQRQSEGAMFGGTEPLKNSGRAPAPLPAEQILASRRNSVPAASETLLMPAGAHDVPTTGAGAGGITRTESTADEHGANTDPDKSKLIQVVGVVNPADEKDLEAIFRKWATAAGWQVSWEMLPPYNHVEVSFPGNFGTDFKGAVRETLKSLGPMEKTLEPLFSDNNKVVRIVEKGARR